MWAGPWADVRHVRVASQEVDGSQGAWLPVSLQSDQGGGCGLGGAPSREEGRSPTGLQGSRHPHLFALPL